MSNSVAVALRTVPVQLHGLAFDGVPHQILIFLGAIRENEFPLAEVQSYRAA